MKDYTHVCVETCFVNDKLWQPGDRATFGAADLKKLGVKEYFKAVEKKAPAKKED